jgi:hypothetical protein
MHQKHLLLYVLKKDQVPVPGALPLLHPNVECLQYRAKKTTRAPQKGSNLQHAWLH